LTGLLGLKDKSVDRTHYLMAALVFLGSFVVYAMTVQRTVPFWDCGEFIASANALGVPHPPGTPLFVLIGRLFSIIPFVTDVAYRINYISVISSAFTALFSYFLAVRIIRYFFNGDAASAISRWISYFGGVAAGFFVAFSETNWGNAVEAEVYGIGLALCVLMVYLTVRYFEARGTENATRIMIFVMFLAVLGIGVHLTVFLVVPVCAISFMLTKDSTRRDWMLLSGTIVLELLLIVLFTNVRNGAMMFMMASAFVGLGLLAMLWKKINWTVTFAIVSVFTIMISFSLFLIVAPIALTLLVMLGLMHLEWSFGVKLPIQLAVAAGLCFTVWLDYGLIAYIIYLAAIGLLGIAAFTMFPQAKNWRTDWKSALAIMVVALVGFSVHIFLPIRSAQRPWIDENHPARDYRTFVSYLDRKQYGNESMVSRMFHRRGTWENQFGRHPHMGFWSYFEGQYSHEGGTFLIWFALGIVGMYTAIKKRAEVGIPFMTLFLLCSAGIVLYMNFADGTKYDFQSGDAYLEVRDRDYFFTPAFVFFGIAMGMGISAALQWLRATVAVRRPLLEKAVIPIGVLLMLLPGVALATNYYHCDRSNNYLARDYAKNILDSCDPNTVLFTSGDNDTFPLWGVQEAYDYRKDIRVLCLSLVNTDWYVEQMKNVFGVPVSLTDEEILWYPYTAPDGREYSRPLKMFRDKPRNREVYLTPNMHEGRMVKVQDMMVDEVVIANQWKVPVFFSSPPYAESPLKLRDHATSLGHVYRIDREPKPGLIDLEKSYDLFMNTYKFTGLNDCKVYRDENATGVFTGLGMSAVRLMDELVKQGDQERAIKLGNHMIAVYPEYWQTYFVLADYYDKANDSAKSDQLFTQLEDTLTSFLAQSPDNQAYMEDLGMTKAEIGRRKKDQGKIDQGLALMKKGFELNANNGYAFRKYITVLYQNNRFTDMQTAATKYTEYKINISDSYAQRILGITPPAGAVFDDN